MKQTLFYLALLFCAVVICCVFSAKAFSQEVKRDGNNFTVEKTLQQSSDVLTAYTFTIKDEVYPIWITKNGRCYVIRISKNGNQYKQYLNKEICLQICKELNVEYKEKQ